MAVVGKGQVVRAELQASWDEWRYVNPKQKDFFTFKKKNWKVLSFKFFLPFYVLFIANF